MMRERVNKALSELKAQAGEIPLNSDNMAAIGFCFGGGAAQYDPKVAKRAYAMMRDFFDEIFTN